MVILLDLDNSGSLEAVHLDDYHVDENTSGVYILNKEIYKHVSNNTESIYVKSTDGIVREIRKTEEEVLLANLKILSEFISLKKAEGCSDQTIKNYYIYIRKLLFAIIKPISEITAYDVRAYLVEYKDNNNISNNTLDDRRRTFNSFFNFLEEEDYIIKNPIRKIHKIKGEKNVQLPFTEDDVELLRDECDNIRDLAIIDFLNSSGVRVSELCGLNIKDIDMDKKEGIVFGKGKKERIIYFDARTRIHLKKYLATRNDNCEALFCTKIKPYRRLDKSGIEDMCRLLGIKAGVDDCHPHRFRRTLATRLLYKNVPIEQVQKILGHSKIETTLIYAQVNQSDVKISHEKFA